MEKFKISGAKKLGGEVTVHGAKNSALPILASTLLVKGESVIHNCPDLSDVRATLNILKSLGCKVKRENNTVCVDATNADKNTIDEKVMRTMRSSIIFLSALLARMGSASIYYPGGCEIGVRPIDLHLKALKDLGVNVEVNGSSIKCKSNSIVGTKIILPFPSVGTTENIIIATVMSKGRTVIVNPAREPEISDLADFLNSAGARISGCGSDTVRIEGVKRLGGTEHTIIPDRIVAATYMACAAVTGGEIELENVMPPHMVSLLWSFRECGCDISVSGKGLRLSAPERLHRIPTLRSLVYPGFPTDAGPALRRCG